MAAKAERADWLVSTLKSQFAKLLDLWFQYRTALKRV